MILSKLNVSAVAYLGSMVNDAVVTMPAYDGVEIIASDMGNRTTLPMLYSQTLNV